MSQTHTQQPQTVRPAVIPGDGIGPEVIAEAEKVLDAATAGSGIRFEKTRFALGATRFLETGDTLTDADLTGAVIREASFDVRVCSLYCFSVGTGPTLAQLYSTASYQAHDLRGVDFTYNNLAGGDFADVLLRAAAFARVVAVGRAHLNSPDASRMLTMSEQLEAAAHLELKGELG